MGDDAKQIVVVVKNENNLSNNLVKFCVLYTMVDLSLSCADVIKKYIKKRKDTKGE